MLCQPLALSIEAIERKRRGYGIEVEAMLREARVHSDLRQRALRGGGMRMATLRRLDSALEWLRAGGPRRTRPNAIVALTGACCSIIEAAVAKDKRLLNAITVKRLRASDAHRASRICRLAVYLVTVEFDIANADAARAFGWSRQAVHQTRHEIETLRDNAQVDALLTMLADMLKRPLRGA